MLLAVDIGNTNISLGVWNGRLWEHQWRLHTNQQLTADEYGITLLALLQQHALEKQIKAVIIASVVPVLSETFGQLSRRSLNLVPEYVTAETDLGLQILTDVPTAVGADRLVNAVAAYRLFSGPAIVIDMGTATKFDVISARGDFLGGVIAPGLGLAAETLTRRAAKLSSVPLNAPPRTIGRNTTEAMQSGLILGYAALIEGVVQRILAEHPDKGQSIHILGTGGLIDLITPHTTIIEYVDPWLTLTGLRVIFERGNR